MQLVVGCITFLIINGQKGIENSLSVIPTSKRYDNRVRLSLKVHHHAGNPVPLLGTTNWKEYEVTLLEGKELNKWYLLAANSQDAAFNALELSMDRQAILKDVRQTNEW